MVDLQRKYFYPEDYNADDDQRLTYAEKNRKAKENKDDIDREKTKTNHRDHSEKRSIDRKEKDDRDLSEKNGKDLHASRRKDKDRRYQNRRKNTTEEIDLSEHGIGWKYLSWPLGYAQSGHFINYVEPYFIANDGNLVHGKLNESTKKSSKERSSRRMKIVLLCVLLLLFVLSLIIVVAILDSRGNNDKDFADNVVVKMEMTLGKTFTQDLEDETSNEYKTLAGEVCQGVSTAFGSEGSVFKDHHIACKVTYIRAGSIIIGFTIRLQGRIDTSTPSSTYVTILRNAVRTGAEFGILQVKSSSIKVITILYDGAVTPTVTTTQMDVTTISTEAQTSTQTPSTTASVEDTPDFTTEIRFTNSTWYDEFSDPSSATYKNFTSEIETEMDIIFEKSFLKDIYNRTEVTGLVKGSVIAVTATFVQKLSFSITDQNSQKVTVKLENEDFQDAFKSGKQQYVSANAKSIFATVNDGDVKVERTTRKEEDIEEVCVSKSDIVFVLDESGSIGGSNFITMKTFVSEYSSRANFKENATQVGIVVFQSYARTAFHLNTYRSAGQIVKAINAIQYSSGGTQIGGALSFVNTHAFTAANGGRTDAFKIVVLMTDGKSDDASAQAKVLKDKGIIIVCIAIGNGVNYPQLNNIVSRPEYVLSATDFNALKEIENILLEATCETKYNCSGDLMKLQPTGKKVGGVSTSRQEAKLDLNDIKARKHCYISAGRNSCIHPALIAAIASRESRAGRLLQSTNGYGDNGAAYGIMQCDINACAVCPDYDCKTFAWDSCEHIIMMTTKVVVPYIKQVKTKHPTWTLEQQLQGGVAAYNFGVGNVQTWQNLDVGSTGDDYSNDVIARAQFLVNENIW